MANPMWFNEVEYLSAKLAQLQADNVKDVNGKAFTNITQVADAFKGAGVDAFAHYNKFGSAEGLAPSNAFKVAEYCEFKLRALQAADATKAEWTGKTWQDVQYTIAKAGMSLGQHYAQYGAVEGVPMSNAFDGNAYLTAKLALLVADPATKAAWEGKKVADLAAAFTKMGIDPYTHYVTYVGKTGEVAADVKVAPENPVNPSGGGRDFNLIGANAVLTNTASVNVSPAGFLSDGNDNIDALTFLGTATIFDASTKDHDTLKATVTGAASANKPNITNIENINLTFGGNAVLDASGITGGQINVAGANASIVNVANNAKLGMVDGYAAALSVTTDVDGAEAKDALTVELKGTVKGASLDIDKSGSNGALETLNLIVSKDSTLSGLTADGSGSDVTIKDIKVSGKGVLTLGAVAKADVTGTIDASASEGAIIATLGAANADIIGSNQADTFELGAATVTAVVKAGKGDDVFNSGKFGVTENMAFDGGEGVDTVNLMAGTHDLTGFSNIEKIVVTNSGTADAAITLGDTVGTFGQELLVDGSGLSAVNGGDANKLLMTYSGASPSPSSNYKLNVIGSANNDTLVGGTRDDVLKGGEGADTITGGAGNDKIDLTETTAAKDYVRMEAGHEGDIITGFKAGAGATSDVFDINYALLGTDGSTAVDLAGYKGTKDVANSNVTTWDGSTTPLNSAAQVILEVNSSDVTLNNLSVQAFRDTFGAGKANAFTATTADKGKVLFVVYDGAGTDANAAVFYVDLATATDTAATIGVGDTVTLVATFEKVGADAFDAANFL